MNNNLPTDQGGELSLRSCLVTGASRGIGRAIAERLLDEGIEVVGVARRFEERLKSRTGFRAVNIDLSKLDELPNALKSLAAEHATIDTVVCNAGYGRFGSLEEFSPRQIRRMIDVNLTSQILVARTFLPLIKRMGRGNMVFIGSEAARTGGRKGAVYSAAKFALRGLAQSLREECSPSGVRVGIVHPGMVQSGFFDALAFGPGEKEDQHLKPEDVADAVWLMISARQGAVIDEIELSPQKKVIRFDHSR